MIRRRILPYILQDVADHKMVMISGPRQTGKTTLATTLPLEGIKLAYYNWDSEKHRNLIRKNLLDESSEYWVLDEIHKYRKWKNWLKGLYDVNKKNHKILITGSARMEMYSRGGDSLQGRYFNYHLHPLTLSETLGTDETDYRLSIVKQDFSQYEHKMAYENTIKLLNISGFPEPFSKASMRFASRWKLNYARRLVREDVRTLEQTQDLDQMEILYERLPDLISNNLSINNLSEDLEVSHPTVSKWIRIFEKLYSCFYVLPYGEPKIRAVKKERKLYLWDWSRIEDPGARLENMVAVHLLRLVHWFEDIYGESLELRYFKDTEGHEVDFIILRKKKPWFCLEVKSSEQDLTKGMKYFLQRVLVPYAFQIQLKSDLDYRHPKINNSHIRIQPVSKFLYSLP